MVVTRVKPRRQHRPREGNLKYKYDPEMSGYTNLAAAIVHMAKVDADRLQGKDEVRCGSQTITKEELIRFFESSWCETLLGETNITGQEIRKKVGI